MRVQAERIVVLSIRSSGPMPPGCGIGTQAWRVILVVPWEMGFTGPLRSLMARLFQCPFIQETEPCHLPALRHGSAHTGELFGLVARKDPARRLSDWELGLALRISIWRNYVFLHDFARKLWIVKSTQNACVSRLTALFGEEEINR